MRSTGLVDIPDDKGIHVKNAGSKGEKYIYKYIKYFRNEEGKPRNKAVCIGKLSHESGKMIPNSAYYSLYKEEPILSDFSVCDYGYSWLFLRVCDEIGLSGILETVFGLRAESLKAMAAYIVYEGGVMDNMAEWQERTWVPGCDHLISSSDASKLFASITPEERASFFRLWVKHQYRGRSVCYDVTSISSYSATMPEVERGYSRDHENPAQYTLAMFCDEETGMPLYYHRYNGSLTDKSNLSFAAANAKDVGIEHIHLILDGGFWDEKRIQSLSREYELFTFGMPAFLTLAQEAVDQCRENIKKYENELPDHRTYSMSIPSAIGGVDGRILVYYDPWNHANLCSELSESIARMEAELKECERFPKDKLKYFSKYFRVTKHETDSGFDYEPDMEKIESLRKNKGFFLLFSNDRKSPASKLLYYYRAKDADEKLFAQIQAEMEGGKIHTHNSETADGKTFVIFLACAVRAYMFGKLQPYLDLNSTSMVKVFHQLSNIRLVDSGGKKRFSKPITKNQREILLQFDAYDQLIESLE